MIWGNHMQYLFTWGIKTVSLPRVALTADPPLTMTITTIFHLFLCFTALTGLIVWNYHRVDQVP